MRWEDFRRSDNVEDDREGGGGFSAGSGGGLGIGTLIVLGLIGWATGINPSILIGGAEMVKRGTSQYQQPQNRPAPRKGAPADSTGQFVAAVLGNTEDVWGDIFRGMGRQYSPAPMRLYRGGERGGCGMAQAAMGPFYCPSDKHIYLDTSFFRDIQDRFHGCSGKACEFAEAYVIAHEVGHHVQDLLGILPKAQTAQRAAGSKGGGERDPGAGGIAGRLLRRRLGEPFQPALEDDRAGRRGGGAADRLGDRRRPAAAAIARLCGARRLHPRLIGDAPALVLDRPEAGNYCGLRYVLGGDALKQLL